MTYANRFEEMGCRWAVSHDTLSCHSESSYSVALIRRSRATLSPDVGAVYDRPLLKSRRTLLKTGGHRPPLHSGEGIGLPVWLTY